MNTIVALASAPGLAGVSVIRVSGPDSFAIARQLHEKGEQAARQPRQLLYGNLADIDDAMVVAFVAPHSYTGEDVVELYTHGNPLIIQQVLDRALSLGARLAEPGEFTKRAYLNNRLDLIQAEAVGDLIQASSQQALHLARQQLGGAWSGHAEKVEQQVLSILARASAWLDFGEEDLSDYTPEDVARDIQVIVEQIDAWLQGAAAATVARDGFKVALVGLPNAGKSSLLNALIGYERAIVTNVAGTTRDTIEHQLHISGFLIELVDTAGLRDSSDAVEALGVARSKAAARGAHLILVLVSADQDAQQLLPALPKSTQRIGIQTKVDTNPQDVDWSLLHITISHKTSSKTGEGIAELRTILGERAAQAAGGESVVTANARQLAALNQAKTELQAAERAAQAQLPLDVVTVNLSAAAEALASLTGTHTSEAMLDTIFSTFCIGK